MNTNTINKNECEHNWELVETRTEHWYSWHCNLLIFYCKKCINTANLVNKVKTKPTSSVEGEK